MVSYVAYYFYRVVWSVPAFRGCWKAVKISCGMGRVSLWPMASSPLTTVELQQQPLSFLLAGVPSGPFHLALCLWCLASEGLHIMAH